MRAYAWVQDREMWKLAWLAANLINGFGMVKKPIQPADLLGLSPRKRVSAKEEWEELKKIFGEEIEWPRA